MAEPCADEGAQEDVEEKARQIFFVAALVPLNLEHNHIAQYKTEGEQQSVPPQREGSDPENFRIYIPKQILQVFTLTVGAHR